MIKRTVILSFLLCLAILGYVQGEIINLDNIWKTLKEVTWKYKYSEEFKAKVAYPDFGASIKALENKEVTITGFVVPVEMYAGEGQEFLILSAFPASSCFFCGGAGPESVIEVYPTSESAFSSLKRTVTFKGKLELNPDDFSHLIYILRDAEYVP